MENINFKEIINNNNIMIKKIFDLIKEKKWDALENLIKSNKNFDYNIKDPNNTYLLEYIIIFNKINILKILIKYEINIDIVTENQKSILFDVIKFSYIDILTILCEYNKKSIGNNILEIKDNEGNIAIFYAIKIHYIDCINILLNYHENFFISNNDLNNILHLSIIASNFEIFKIIFKKFPNFNNKNIFGENYIHLMIKYETHDILIYFLEILLKNKNYYEIINTTDNKKLSILHYIAINMDSKSITILFDKNILDIINFNIQDISGNTFYHYFINNIINYNNFNKDIINNIFYINNIFIKFKFNINLYNIDGNTPGHIYFENINFINKNKLDFLTDFILNNSDLNLQNFNGESIFYIIVKNNYWKQLFNKLIHKKLDIFILINKHNTIFDYINNDDFDKFVDLITTSYLNQLSEKNNSIKWIDYWDNRCKKNINFEQLNETELELIKEFNLNKDDDNICKQIINNKIKKSINSFLNNKNIYDVESYPINKKFIKVIKKYPEINISTISGTTLDILCGLIYLKNKFTDKLDSSIKLLENKNNIIRCNNTICEIQDFELIFKNQKLYVTNINSNYLNNIILNSIKNDIHYFIIPIGIELIIDKKNYSHSNYLFFDLINKEFERFEPHGMDPPVNFNYNAELFDNLIKDYFKNLKFKYFPPHEYLPKIGLQIQEINEVKNNYIGDPNGFCSIWCIWWAEMRISNPMISRQKLFKFINKEIINYNLHYRNLIRNYSGFIVNLRDSILKSANTNINEWINDIINPINLDKLNDVLKNYFN